MTPSGIEMA